MVTTACTPTACGAVEDRAHVVGVTAPHASRWVCASTSGDNGSGGGGAGRFELTATP